MNLVHGNLGFRRLFRLHPGPVHFPRFRALLLQGQLAGIVRNDHVPVLQPGSQPGGQQVLQRLPDGHSRYPKLLGQFHLF